MTPRPDKLPPRWVVMVPNDETFDDSGLWLLLISR
jgi:hypothetical protein